MLRLGMLQALSKYPIHLISSFVSFLNRCIDETWVRTEPNGAFQGYNQNLIIILDILTAFPINHFPPALFQTAAYSLQRVSYYIGDGDGKSWAAKKTWDERKNALAKEVVAERKSIADQHGYGNLKLLIETINT
jgi:hypothetical protein